MVGFDRPAIRDKHLKTNIMNKLTLLGAKSQIESLELQVRRYEKKAEKAYSETAAARYWGLAAFYSGRIGELRRWVAERELNIIGKEVVC